jgi:sigma-E factor negative regulatory protein RseA
LLIELRMGMSDLSQESAERVSALTDGRLDGDEFSRCLHELAHNPQALASWDAYHVMGRSLRSGAVDAQACDFAFVARLSERLKHETVQIEPVAATPIAVDKTYLPPPAANQDYWRLVAGLASVMLVAVLAWQGFAPVAQGPAGTSVARLAAPVGNSGAVLAVGDNRGQVLIRSDGTSVLTASTDLPVMIRDPQLDALLAAHRNFAGASALQMAPGFVRNANFEEVGR